MEKKIISKFKEKPKTEAGWRALWLGLPLFFVGPVLGIFAAVIRPAIDKIAGEAAGAGVGFVFGLVAVPAYIIAALAAGGLAFRAGERSWAVWLGIVPSFLAVLFFIFMIIGEFIFPH